MIATQQASLLLRTLKAPDYSDHFTKQDFVRAARSTLTQLATDLGLERGSYEIRSNTAGCTPDVCLHTANLYVSMRPDANFGEGPCFLYRGCQGLRDFVGDQNHWMTYSTFAANYSQALAVFQSTIARARARQTGT